MASYKLLSAKIHLIEVNYLINS